jgi:hypothetical protein
MIDYCALLEARGCRSDWKSPKAGSLDQARRGEIARIKI